MQEYRTVTIAKGSAVSEAVDLSEDKAAFSGHMATAVAQPVVVKVVPPRICDPGCAELRVEGSLDGAEWYPVTSQDGTPVAVAVGGTNNAIVHIDPVTALMGLAQVRFRVVDSSGTELPQSLDRVVGVVLGVV